MNSNNQNRDDDMSFRQLMSESQFDDSVDENHQRELRLQALRAFDQAQLNTPTDRSLPATGRVRRTGAWAAAAMAVCLLTVAAIWFRNTDKNSRHAIVEHPVVMTDFPADNMLVDVLTEVAGWKSDVSPNEFFRALEISQQEDEARQLEQKSVRMHWFLESSL